MTDWKKKIDKKIDNEEEARKAEQKKWEIESHEIARREHEVKVQELGRKFKCHICNKPARKPVRESVQFHMGLDTYYEDCDNWSEPADLWQCSKCDQWTCEKHLYKEICQECAEKM